MKLIKKEVNLYILGNFSSKTYLFNCLRKLNNNTDKRQIYIFLNYISTIYFMKNFFRFYFTVIF